MAKGSPLAAKKLKLQKCKIADMKERQAISAIADNKAGISYQHKETAMEVRVRAMNAYLKRTGLDSVIGLVNY